MFTVVQMYLDDFTDKFSSLDCFMPFYLVLLLIALITYIAQQFFDLLNCRDLQLKSCHLANPHLRIFLQLELE